MPLRNRLFYAGLLLIGGLVAALLIRPLGVSISTPVPTLSPDRRLLEAERNTPGRPIQALYHVEALASEVGWSPSLHRQAGDLWAAAGDETQAIFHWEQAPSDDLLLRSLAAAYLQQENWAAAVDTLTALAAAQPDDPWPRYHLGMILAPLDPTRAEPHLRAAALDPTYLETARAVRVALLENRGSDALDNIGIPVLVGLEMIDQQAWAYAELALTHANTLYLAANGTPLPEALAYLSLAQNEAGKDGTAAITQAVALSPNDPQIRFLEALHYRHFGAYDTSLNAIIQAVALSPESATVYAELGTAYRLTGNLEQAEYWLRAAVAFSGNDPTFQQNLADFYAAEAYNLGSDGLVALDSALQNDPNDPNLLAGMGWAFYSLGDHAEGRALLEQALAIAPGNPRAGYYLARVLIEQDADIEAARGLLQTVADGGSLYRTEAARMLAALPPTTFYEE